MWFDTKYNFEIECILRKNPDNIVYNWPNWYVFNDKYVTKPKNFEVYRYGLLKNGRDVTKNISYGFLDSLNEKMVKHSELHKKINAYLAKQYSARMV